MRKKHRRESSTFVCVHTRGGKEGGAGTVFGIRGGEGCAMV